MKQSALLAAAAIAALSAGALADTPPPPPPPPEAAAPAAASSQSPLPEQHGYTPMIHQHSAPQEQHPHQTEAPPKRTEARERAQLPPPPPPEATPPRSSAASPPQIAQPKPVRAEPSGGEAPGFLRVFTAPGNDFMKRALCVGLMVAVVSAYLGIYIILKRVVFLGLALAEVSSAGVALGLALHISPILGSIGAMFAGVIAFSIRWSPRRVPQDAYIGVGFAFAAAAALLLVAASPVGEAHMLDLLKGDILTVQPWDLWATGIALGLVVLLHLLFAKEMLFTSFDPETAAASGYNVRLWEVLLFASVGLTIALGIHATGILFTSGVLVIPAATALLLSRRFTCCAWLAVGLGAVPVPLGLYVSFVTDLPASASVVAISFAVLIMAALAARVSHAHA